MARDGAGALDVEAPEAVIATLAQQRAPWARGWRSRSRTAGCYAYQVDGRTFSYLVIFEARLAEGG